MLIKVNIASCQWETRSKSLPLVKLQNEELKQILDSIFFQEQKCDYYNDTLLLGIEIRINPDDSNMFSCQFETNDRKSVMFRTGPLGALSYFKYKEHICLVYFYMPGALFEYADSVTTFHYQYYNHSDSNNSTSNDIIIIDYEDDSFSQWIYYYYDDHFHFYEYFSYCK